MADDTPEHEPDSSQPLTLHNLSSIRSLLINPSTPNTTLSQILKTLTNSQNPSHHTLTLLSHPSLSHLQTTTTVDSLASISQLPSSKPFVLDDERFVSLCFGPSISGRVWMLRNAGLGFNVRPALLFTVLLGFTNDPYPNVRAASLEGLVRLSECGEFNDVSMINGCYQRGVQLLNDMEDDVRLAAVRVVRSLFWIQFLTFSCILCRCSVENFRVFKFVFDSAVKIIDFD